PSGTARRPRSARLPEGQAALTRFAAARALRSASPPGGSGHVIASRRSHESARYAAEIGDDLRRGLPDAVLAFLRRKEVVGVFAELGLEAADLDVPRPAVGLVEGTGFVS